MHRFRYAALITMLVIFAILLAACTTVPAAPAESNADAAATEAPVAAVPAGGVTELRITWYDDGSEGAILRDLLDRFEADNPDIKVIIDTVPLSLIHI